MAGVGEFAGGFLQAFSEARVGKQDLEQKKKLNDMILKLQEQALNTREDQVSAIEEIAKRLRGGGKDVPQFSFGGGPEGLGMEQTGAIPGPMGGPKQSLSEIIANSPDLLLRSGGSAFKDISDFQNQTNNQQFLQQFLGANSGDTGSKFRVQDVVLGPGGPTPRLGLDPMQEPITSPSDLASFRMPDGSIPPPGTSPAQIIEMGGKQITTSEAANESSVRAISQVKGTLRKYVDKLFTGESGVLNRALETGKRGLEMFTQSNPDVVAYRSFSEGTIAPLIRSLGEKGSLAEGDVSRGLNLIPTIWPIPDTRDVAQQKMMLLEQLIDVATTRGPEAAAEILNEAQSSGVFNDGWSVESVDEK